MQPRYYQTAANNAAWQYLSTQPGNPLIVLPTGAGKSLVIAMLIEQARKFDARVIVLQHRKELIEQNAEKIRLLCPGVSVGLNSAGLRRHAFSEDVICAGIQSVYRKAAEFGRRELILIDEAHLINHGNDASMYSQFIADLLTINPRGRVAGLTATPYRTGQGPICGRDKLFQRICYEAFTGDLIREGFLCPITNRPADASIDTSQIAVRGGEFVQRDMERAFDVDDVILEACKETVAKCHDRRSILTFCSGVHHAEQVAETLRQLTRDRVAVVTGETLPIERSAYLADFKTQQLRWLVNCDVLTTGFDAPCIDAIALMRATMSPGLSAQMIGRGLRKHESKQDTLILDFGGNIKRHGSLDDPNYGRASVVSNGKGESAAEQNGRGKECLNCGIDCAANCRECPECGFLFPVNHEARADETSAIVGESEPETWLVDSVSWGLHQKKNAPDAPPTLRVNYVCRPEGTEGNLSTEQISEWVCVQHQGFAMHKASQWWQARSESEFPTTVEQAVSWLDQGRARHPATITTKKDGRWQRIVSVEFVDEKPAAEEWVEGGVEFSFGSDEVPF
jgi:DNA repair protein RadD